MYQVLINWKDDEKMSNNECKNIDDKLNFEELIKHKELCFKFKEGNKIKLEDFFELFKSFNISYKTYIYLISNNLLKNLKGRIYKEKFLIIDYLKNWPYELVIITNNKSEKTNIYNYISKNIEINLFVIIEDEFGNLKISLENFAEKYQK